MSTNPTARAWVHVRADALRRNYRHVERVAGDGARLLPMVKADAYGLGMRETVAVLEPLEPWGYGVAAVSEGLALRAMDVRRPILVCSPCPPDEVEAAVARDLHLSVSTADTIERIAVAARSRGCRAAVHVDVDTGMGRSGFPETETGLWREMIDRAGDAIDWVGCSTHLHSADESSESVEKQWARLEAVLDAASPLPDDLLVHVLNSAGVFRRPTRRSRLVRPGIFLYGGRVGPDQESPEPVVSVHARVVHLREAPPGTSVGYGRTHQASKPARWATLAIGYGDGYPRSLSNRGCVRLGRALAPIVGRISMDVTVVDISDHGPIAIGDVATLLGSDEGVGIDLDGLAEEAGTISYEILTGLSGRLPRVWTDEEDGS